MQRETEPAVSIILPTYNGLPYLRESVESVRAQTFRNWELIVIDDGSTDGSVAWIESLADPRVIVLRSEHTGHRARLRNRGIAVARGEWVTFNDSDDRWKPNKLERQLAYHRERRDLRWSYTGRTVIDEQGNVYRHPRHQEWVPHAGRIVQPLLTLAATIALPSVIVQRALLEKAGGFWDRPWGEDYELWLRLAEEAECGIIDEPLVEIRAHASTSAGRTEVIRAYIEIHRRFAERSSDPEARRIALHEQARHSVRLGRALLSRNSVRPAFDVLFSAVRIRPLYLDAWRALARGAASYVLPSRAPKD